MAASSSTSNAPLSSTLSEEKWVDQTRKNLENQTPLDLTIPVAVFQVPNSISAVKPQAYAPQVISFGPFHYLQTDLHQMERYKIEIVKSCWQMDQINLVVEKLTGIGPTIRACYHKYLVMNDDTLALLIAIDGLFLIYLLNRRLNRFTYDATIFSDVMMLENQMPLILLKEIVNAISLPGNDDDKVLFSMMRTFCELQSPFALQSNHQDLEESKVLHLLDLLYKLITMHESNHGDGEWIDADVKVPLIDEASQESNRSRRAPVTLNINPDGDKLIENVKEILSHDVLSSTKPARFISSLPWDTISNLLGYSSSVKDDSTKNPMVDKIDIPSVSKLSRMGGITFQPVNNGNLKARFDEEAATLYLPAITLNGNSEVILRNLLACEMANRSSTSGYENHTLAEYIDLMSGMIFGKEDAQLLRDAGVIKGDLTSLQVADMFNGMNKWSQKVYNDIADRINEYYGQRPKVKAYRFVKKRVYRSWKFLTFVTTIVLLLLTILESFCSVYDCHRHLN